MADPLAMNAAKKACVFLSYSRKDTPFVDRLAAAMSAHGYRVLLDREDISGGEAWKERLEQLILQADAVAFVITPDSVASPVCDWETARTLELGKRLIPLCLRAVDRAPQQLTRLNYIFFDADEKFDDGVERLSRACDVDISWVREHTRLTDLAARWDAGGRRDDALLRGEGLSAAETWHASRPAAAPEVHQTLMAFLQAGRAEEVAALEREGARLKRMRRLQVSVSGLLALAAVIVLVAGLGVARLISGLGAQRSVVLAELARQASEEGQADRAARYALAGLIGADWPLIGYDASNAEAELRRALAAPLRAIGPSPGLAAFSPDGARIISEGGSNLIIWHANTGRTISELILGEEDAFVTLSPDGARFVSVTSDVARLWSAETGREIATLGDVTSVVWSGDGARLLTSLGSSPRARLLEAATGREIGEITGGRWLGGASFTSDGSRIITVGDGIGRVWDADSAREIAVLRGVNHAEFSRDGAKLVTIGDDFAARVWDTGSWREIALLRGHEDSVWSAAFSPDGTRIVTTSADQTVRIWNGTTGRALVTWNAAEVEAATFSPDGARLVISLPDENVVRIFDASSGREVALLSQHGNVSPVTFNHDGSRFLSISENSTVSLWNAATGSETAVLSGHEGQVTRAVFSPDGSRIVTASRDGTARVWDVGTGTEIALLRVDQERPVSYAAFGPDGARVVTTLYDEENGFGISAQVWDLALARGQPAPYYDEEDREAVSPDGSRRVAFSDGSWRVVDAATASHIATLGEDGHYVRSIAFSPDGARIVTGSADHNARVWDAATGQVLAVLRGHGGWVTNVAFSPDGARVLTISSDNSARLWNSATGREVAVLRQGQHRVNSAAYSPDGAYIVTVEGETAQVWDGNTGVEVAALRRHEHLVYSAAFSSDSTRVVTTSDDGTARIWEATTGREITVLRGHGRRVTNAAFSPDNSQIVTASEDATARIWNAATGQEIAVLQGHAGEVYAAAWSSDGNRIVTTGYDGRARVWDVATWREIAATPVRGAYGDVAFSPDGTSVVISSGRGADRVWALPPLIGASRSELLETACTHTLANGGGRFTGAELNAAPVLDHALDSDACAPAGLWRRLAVYLGLVRAPPPSLPASRPD